MKTPKIKITNDSPQADGLRVVIFQTASHSGWKKVTAWHAPGLPKGSSAEFELPEAYSVALEYTRDEVTLETAPLSVPTGMGAFKITSSALGLELQSVENITESRRLEVVADTSFEGYVELLILKGKERIFPKTQLGPGWGTSPLLNGPYYVALFTNGKPGVDFFAEFASPKVAVEAWDEVRVTGNKKEGYALKVIGKFKDA